MNPLQMKSCTLIEKKNPVSLIFILIHKVLANQSNCAEWKHNDIFLI